MLCVYKQNCYQREAVLRPENNQIIYLTLRHFWSGCMINHTADGTEIYTCRANRTFRSARERWWYMAASHCGSVQVVGKANLRMDGWKSAAS